ncbi:DUF169 domain-containing protein [Candidatus Bariatricus faecipullorum]
MEERKIQQAMKALGLKRQIIGVRFLVFRQDYEASKGEEMEKSTLCQLVLWAGDGKKVKAGMENLSCRNGAYAVGMCSVPEEEKSGRKEFTSGDYESLAVARQICENKQFIPQNIYGIEIAPLEKMGEADIVMMIGTAKDIMRIMQGYVRYYGVAKNVVTVGKCGVCSELISRPFMNNDINVSLLSRCARKNGDYQKGEMGISMPVHMVNSVLTGILETVNLTENNGPKREILERLDYPEELGFSIRMNYDYAIQGMEYQKYCAECMKEEQ